MISSALAGEPVELHPVQYGSLLLGTIDDLAPDGPRFMPAGRQTGSSPRDRADNPG
jgi:hypothetical protein